MRTNKEAGKALFSPEAESVWCSFSSRTERRGEWLPAGGVLTKSSSQSTSCLVCTDVAPWLWISPLPREVCQKQERQLHNCLVHGADKPVCHQRKRESRETKDCGSSSQSGSQVGVRWHLCSCSLMKFFLAFSSSPLPACPLMCSAG